MEKIGEGYFYNVFNLNNGRVLKQKKDFKSISNSLGKEVNSLSKWIKTCSYISKCKSVTQEIKDKITHFPELSKLLGNPKFNNSTDFEQDKVILLMDYLDTHSFKENKLIVDKYITLIENLLTFGIHDYVYKFKNGYGVSQNGEVIFIDFNEVTFSKHKVLSLATANHWHNEAQYRKYEEGDLKQYLGKRLGECLTSENIESLWRKAYLG